MAFTLMWPFEVLKNMHQADFKEGGNTVKERAKYVYSNYGLNGFYRGLVPGIGSVFVRNGTAMLVMQFANKQLKKAGLRN
jgi:hypothetical protein